jgi:hypothetical protein
LSSFDSLKIHGYPIAARPIIIPSIPYSFLILQCFRAVNVSVSKCRHSDLGCFSHSGDVTSQNDLYTSGHEFCVCSKRQHQCLVSALLPHQC